MKSIRSFGSSTITVCLAILLNLTPLMANFGSPQGDASKQPIHKENLVNALNELRRGDSQAAIVNQVRARGVDFQLTSDIERDLRNAGAGSALLTAVRESFRRPPSSTSVPSPTWTTVLLNVSVIDRNNRPINNLRQEDFKVYEDGVLKPIESLSTDGIPSTYGLAIQTSGSTRPDFQSLIDAAKTIIISHRRGDEAFLERFISSDKIETVQDFTASKDALMDGLDTLYIEGGQTAVIDGVYLAAERVADYKKGGDDDRRRRALIVVTNGEDRASYYPETQLFQRLREEDLQIYVIGFVNDGDNQTGAGGNSPREKAVRLINRLASETGGRAFFAQSASELKEIAATIVSELHAQYVISYSSMNKPGDAGNHSIKVEVVDVPTHDRRIGLALRRNASRWQRIDGR